MKAFCSSRTLILCGLSTLPNNTGEVLWYTSEVCPSVRPSVIGILFQDSSSYRFHWILLKLSGQLDLKVVQHISFQGFSRPNFDRVVMFFNDFSDFDFVSHPEKLKIHGWGTPFLSEITVTSFPWKEGVNQERFECTVKP